MSPVFYDNEAIQTAFCDMLPKKTWTLLKASFPDSLKATLERLIECLKSSGNNDNMERSQSDDGRTPMDISQDMNHLPETEGQIDVQFEDACDNIVTALLGISSMGTTYTPEKEETETITHALQTDVHALLRVSACRNIFSTYLLCCFRLFDRLFNIDLVYTHFCLSYLIFIIILRFYRCFIPHLSSQTHLL